MTSKRYAKSKIPDTSEYKEMLHPASLCTRILTTCTVCLNISLTYDLNDVTPRGFQKTALKQSRINEIV